MPWFSSTPKQIPVDCFFCLSPAFLDPQPTASGSKQRSTRTGTGSELDYGFAGVVPGGEEGTKWNWQCLKCHCWNVRDKRGEMISDNAAMHDATLNHDSYALRAQQSTAHIPSGKPTPDGTFCHDCLTNQTMIISLLANYLPDEHDPTYKALHDDLDNYVASLHNRFPPVCANCQPKVDAALRKADQKAHGAVWSLALKRGQERGERSDRETVIDEWAMLVWKMRGVLFGLSVVLSLSRGFMSFLAPAVVQNALHTRFSGLSAFRFLALFHAVSIFWIVWDPYWLAKVRSENRIKVVGREVWVRDMLSIYVIRLFSLLSTNSSSNLDLGWMPQAVVAIEVVLLAHAFFNLRTHQPVALKLVRPTALSLPATPVRNESSEAYHFSHLNLDGVARTPQALRHDQPHPIFGRVSFPDALAPTQTTDNMDWEPTPSKAVRVAEDDEDDSAERQAEARRMNWDSFGVGLQRLFPKAEQASTGLEALFGAKDLFNDPAERMDGVEHHPRSGFAPGPTHRPDTSIVSNPVVNTAPSIVHSRPDSALVLDADLVRKAMIGFTGLRLLGAAGALITYLSNETLYDLLFSSSSRTITNLELGANVLDVIIGLNGGSKTTNARMILICLFLVVRAATRTISAHGLVALGWDWTVEYPRWIRVGEWAVWGLVDFVCAVAM